MKSRITRFTAITMDGQQKSFRRYSDACEWLDSIQPQYATGVFRMDDEPSGSSATVRHAPAVDDAPRPWRTA